MIESLEGTFGKATLQIIESKGEDLSSEEEDEGDEEEAHEG